MFASLTDRFVRRWRVFWLWRAGVGFAGRQASRLAAIGIGRHRKQTELAAMTRKGFVSPAAEVVNLAPVLGEHVFVAERTVLARYGGEGELRLGDRVQLHRDSLFELGVNGSISIGPYTAIQHGCTMISIVEPITIGARCQVACHCALYSYDHGIDPDGEIFRQPLVSKGPIVLEEDVWLGAGVKVLSGVRIGRGAVVGAGSVVTRDIPAFAIAAGVPCKVIKFRGGDLPSAARQRTVERRDTEPLLP